MNHGYVQVPAYELPDYETSQQIVEQTGKVILARISLDEISRVEYVMLTAHDKGGNAIVTKTNSNQ